MTRAVRAAALALALLVAAGLASPRPAAAWTAGPCPTATGVTLVVDFSAFGGGIAVRCVPTRPSSGLAALQEAGFSVAMVTSMPGFVCRIDGLPDAAAESCASTPPPSASWSYWTATRGGSWGYSPVGAGGTRPADGSVEGWSFTTGPQASPPGIAPPAYAATPRPTVQPTPRPTPPPTITPAAPVPATPVPTAAAAETPAASAAEATPTASASAMASATEAPPSASPTSSVEPSPNAGPAGGEVTPPGGGSPVGALVGIGLVAVIGTAAFASRRLAGAGR